jgi:hypothetical protein
MISITLKDVKIELTREEAEEIISQLDEEEDDGSHFESEDEEEDDEMSYGECELAIFLDDELGLDWCKELHKELTAKQS